MVLRRMAPRVRRPATVAAPEPSQAKARRVLAERGLSDTPGGGTVVMRERTESQAGPYLTRTEAARRLKMSLKTFDRRVRPHLPKSDLGRSQRYHVDDLDRVARSQVEPTRPPMTAAALPPVDERVVYFLNRLKR